KDKLTKSYGKEMMVLSLKFMTTEHEELYNLAKSIAEKTELNIKEHTDIINTLIDILQSLQPPDSVDDLDGTEFEKYIDCLNSVTNTIFNSFGFTLGKSYGKVLMNLSMKFIKINHEVFHRLAEKIARMMVLDDKGDKAAFIEVMKMLDGVLKDDNLPLSSTDTLNSAVKALIEAGSKSF
ncbi:hypothetical protein Bpfe_000188, partial [Biomphalaria pfeifferi]